MSLVQTVTHIEVLSNLLWFSFQVATSRSGCSKFDCGVRDKVPWAVFNLGATGCFKISVPRPVLLFGFIHRISNDYETITSGQEFSKYIMFNFLHLVRLYLHLSWT